MRVRRVGFHVRSELARASLHLLCVDALHARGGRPRSGVELRDVHFPEIVLAAQRHRRVPVFLSLPREAADDVRGDGDIRHVCEQVVAHRFEFPNRVLAPHRVEHGVRARLHGHVQERVH